MNNSQDLIVEKTPRYIVNQNIPERISKIYLQADPSGSALQHLKFIHLYCNPTPRAHSDFVHMSHNKHSTEKQKNLAKFHSDFNYFVQKTVPEMQKCQTQGQKFCPDSKLNFNDSVSLVYDEGNKIMPLWSTITNSLYIILIRKWVEFFPEKFQVRNLSFRTGLEAQNNWQKFNQFLFINGDQIIQNLTDVILKTEKELNLGKFYQVSKFVQDPKNGYWCYQKHQQLKCLFDVKRGKGKTRNETKRSKKEGLVSNSTKEILDEFFKGFSST